MATCLDTLLLLEIWCPALHIQKGAFHHVRVNFTCYLDFLLLFACNIQWKCIGGLTSRRGVGAYVEGPNLGPGLLIRHITNLARLQSDTLYQNNATGGRNYVCPSSPYHSSIFHVIMAYTVLLLNPVSIY